MTSRSSLFQKNRTTPQRVRDNKVFVAVFRDDYAENNNETYGVYQVFHHYQDCLDYCVDMVFDRAAWLRTEPYDLVYGKLKDGTYPIMRREAVRKRLQREKDFTLGIKFDTDGMVLETVTVGWRETEIK